MVRSSVCAAVRSKPAKLIVGLAITGLLAVGCSSSGSSSGSGVADDGEVTEATEAVEAAYAGTDGPVPSSGPPAATDKSIWVITCGQAADGCATPGNAVVEAAEAIGWKATLCDGKLNPTTYSECVTTGTAASPDAIVLTAVDCQFVQAPLEAARSRGIKIYGVNAFDCDTADGPALFDAQVQYHGFDTFADLAREALGPQVANYIISKTDGAARTLLVRENDNLSAKALIDGVEATLDSCSGCTTYTVDISLEDLLSGQLVNKVSAALVQHPDVNAVAAPFDAAIPLGIGQAVSSSGRDIILTGNEGLAGNLDLIEQGQQTMAAGLAAGWTGWAAVDGLNRLFAGEPQVDSGIGSQTIDADHNLPTATEYYDGNVDETGKPEQDYRQIYMTMWGK